MAVSIENVQPHVAISGLNRKIRKGGEAYD
jgi:hypothetical protein